MHWRQQIARSRWLARVPHDFREDVLAACIPRTLTTGEWLFGMGDDIAGPVGVISGAAVLELPVSGETLQPVWLFHPGEWIGVMAAMHGQQRLATLRALGPTVVAMLPSSALQRLAASHPEGWRLFGMISNQNAIRAQSVGLALMKRDGRARVARILQLISQSGFADDPAPVPLVLSQGDLAGICGLSRNAFARHAERLQDEGLISLSYRRIEILSPERLAQVAAG